MGYFQIAVLLETWKDDDIDLLRQSGLKTSQPADERHRESGIIQIMDQSGIDHYPYMLIPFIGEYNDDQSPNYHRPDSYHWH